MDSIIYKSSPWGGNLPESIPWPSKSILTENTSGIVEWGPPNTQSSTTATKMLESMVNLTFLKLWKFIRGYHNRGAFIKKSDWI